MIPEIGHLLLIIATVLSLLLAIIPMLGLSNNNDYLISYYRLLSNMMISAFIGAIICLGISFITNDFSVAYVADHSNTQLATFYKIAAIWGSHEGSMLFWVSAIALWTAIIANTHANNHHAFFIRTVSVLALVIFGFSLFIIFTSNPFVRLLPNFPIEGRDLNPILQNIGLIIHPPLLFLGYVGLTVCFAASVAALIGKEFTQQHARYLRPWALMAWVFLTGGNAFGSWWAYNELGWGGWWFWDPVENASFIPWLVATALVHSVTMSERLGQCKKLTLFLAILAFSLSLLGTFIVRSGVVQSVHAFAADPTRGMSILFLLIVFAGSALGLFATRAQYIQTRDKFALISRNSLLLIGNLLFVVAALSVLLGSYYPIIYRVLTGVTISVGAPYFNSIFVPIVVILSLLMGLAPLLRWQVDKRSNLTVPAILLLISTTTAAIFNVALEQANVWFFLGLASVTWLVLTIMVAIIQHQQGADKHHSRRFYAMCLAHLGVAMAILAGTVVSNLEQEEVLSMGPNQGRELAGYTFVFEQTQHVTTQSYDALQANILVMDSNENPIAYVYPQRRTFKTNGMQMSAAGVHSSPLKDLYVSMGTPLNDTEYLIRISYKPLINGLWLGALMMMIAGLVVVFGCKSPLYRHQSQTARPLKQLQTLSQSQALQEPTS
ncbi:heme lyase CcmF/NrfE family subunit [Shewanella sp. MMG014]|uniref:heme lyase CcmF/NrfE family subunit n=1 Tax=Shewanella sp. MMG014 TaxID=2822691 RepID=UPI001B39386A|nr:heme lyase CcmF/NrfE family subunit [Shewanella sp. MMG014]MBQ4889401.1 heme lyase CcmF/NrfE family subunit [Shewanella sp. MMG014]